MRDEDAIYTEMFRRLKLYGSTNSTIFATNPEITECFVDFNAMLTLYEKECDELEVKTTGTTEDKVNTREQLEIIVLGIAKPLAGHFFKAKNMEVYEQVKCSPSMLSTIRESELISFATNLVSTCTANPLALTANKITPDRLIALTTIIAGFKTIEPEPQTNIKNKSGKIKVKDATRRKIVSLIRNRLTNAMYGYIGTEDALLADYLNIIKLVHTGIRHVKTGEITVLKSFKVISATTNAAVSNVTLTVAELELTIKCRKDGTCANAAFPIKTFTIQAYAYGYEVYNGQQVMTDIDYEIITIMMVPVSKGI